MRPYRVELRAVPDTPREEEQARRQGRVLGPQTVVYPQVYAETPEAAAAKAVEWESRFLYRETIWLFCDPIPSEEYGVSLARPMPRQRVLFERTKP